MLFSSFVLVEIEEQSYISYVFITLSAMVSVALTGYKEQGRPHNLGIRYLTKISPAGAQSGTWTAFTVCCGTGSVVNRENQFCLLTKPVHYKWPYPP